MADQKSLVKGQDLGEELVKWRRHIHQHPGVKFEVEDTASFVESLLHSWKVETTRVAGTGIVATIPGSSNRTVGLRADMDALEMTEVEGRPYGSKTPGMMHACGHDAHVSIALGVAKTWASLPVDNRPGTLKLFFQPAEEGPGGAKPMVEAGAVDDTTIEAIVALHVNSLEPLNKVITRHGPLFASADWFEAEVIGEGGHGAYPHTTKDPIHVAAELILSLQRLSSREVDPLQPVVMSFGSVHGGTAQNIIPDKVALKATLRTLDEEIRAYMHRRIQEIVEQLPAVFGLSGKFTLHKMYDVGVNHPDLTDKVVTSARKIVGDDLIHWRETAQMGGEDFYYFGKTGIPVSMFFLGSAPSSGPVSHHSPEFDLDERVLTTGVNILLQFLQDFFAEPV